MFPMLIVCIVILETHYQISLIIKYDIFNKKVVATALNKNFSNINIEKFTVYTLKKNNIFITNKFCFDIHLAK